MLFDFVIGFFISDLLFFVHVWDHFFCCQLNRILLTFSPLGRLWLNNISHLYALWGGSTWNYKLFSACIVSILLYVKLKALTAKVYFILIYYEFRKKNTVVLDKSSSGGWSVSGARKMIWYLNTMASWVALSSHCVDQSETQRNISPWWIPLHLLLDLLMQAHSSITY